MDPENIMFCPRCGSDNPQKAKYCNECGFDLHEIRSILLKQEEPDKLPGSENASAPTSPARPAVPAKKEDPKKPYVRTTSLLPDGSDETPRQYPVPVQSFPEPEKTAPVFAQSSLSVLPPPVPESPLVTMPERIRNPSLAVALSLIPGLGQVYNGMLVRGIILFIATLIGLLIFIIPGVCIWIYSIYDAFRTAQKINRGKVAFGLQKN